MKATLFRYLKSTLITFLSGFFSYFVMTMDTFNGFQDFNSAVLVGAVFAGVRMLPKLFVDFLDGSLKEY